jgi:hypothetical protein
MTILAAAGGMRHLFEKMDALNRSTRLGRRSRRADLEAGREGDDQAERQIINERFTSAKKLEVFGFHGDVGRICEVH